MRQICLDTETTGMDPAAGDRIVEIGCVEIIGRSLSDAPEASFHVYLNPERDVPAEAARVHGLTTEMLADKPLFADVVDDFLRFIDGAELIIHNAPFDVGFLDMELAKLKRGKLKTHCSKITDSLELAKKMFPGLRNTLDALCSRYDVDRSARTFHGALLDSQLLAEVYLSMTRKQGSLLGESLEAGQAIEPMPDNALLAHAASTDQERAAHQAFLEMIAKKSKSGCAWLQATQDSQKSA